MGLKKSNSQWFVIIVFLVIGGGFSSLFTYLIFLDVVRDTPREEHSYLVHFFQPGSSEEFRFERLDILSKSSLFIAGHGTWAGEGKETFIRDDSGETRKYLSPEEIAEIIINNIETRNLPSNIPIYLMACNSGRGSNSFAMRLSQLIPNNISAPTGWLAVYPWGSSGTGSSKLKALTNTGHLNFKSFEGGKEVIHQG